MQKKILNFINNEQVILIKIASIFINFHLPLRGICVFFIDMYAATKNK